MSRTARSLDRLRGEFRRLAQSDLDGSTLRRELVERLRRLLAVDGYCFHTADPLSLALTTTITEGVDAAQGARVFANEYLERDFLKHARLVRDPGRVGVLSVVTGGEVWRSRRWRTVLDHEGMGDELRAALVDGDSCWGYLRLFRRQGRPGFSAGDAAAVRATIRELAAALRVGLLAAPAAAEADRSPGVLLVDGHGQAAEVTAEADRWLRRITPDDRWATRRRLPEGVMGVAFAAHAGQVRGTPAPSVRSVLRAHDGTWLSLHASALTGREGAHRPDDPSPAPGRVSVVIQPAQPSELAPVLMRAYRLTPGEREVVGLVLGGLSTRAIAAQLFLSPYTVQDRLKAVFDKTGVRSRGELAAGLQGR